MDQIIRLINMITKKDLSGKIDLPQKWKLKFPADLPAGNFKLTPQQRHWLESHEHFHGSREILAVISGQALLRLDGRLVRVSRGEILVIEPWMRHTTGHLPDESAVFWWCKLAPDSFRTLLWRQNRAESYQVMKSNEFVRLLDQAFSEKGTAAAELQYFVAGVICRSIRIMLDQNSSSQDRPDREIAVQKVLHWMETLPVLKCSLGEAASRAGYSLPHFQRIFKEYTGRSFHDYLQVRRAERLHGLLSFDNITKKEIATQLGFASTAALNHWERELHKFSEKVGPQPKGNQQISKAD